MNKPVIIRLLFTAVLLLIVIYLIAWSGISANRNQELFMIAVSAFVIIIVINPLRRGKL